MQTHVIAGHVTSEDTVCVVGGSHSAILVLMNLLDMHNGPKVVNLYRSDLRYARETPSGAFILDNTGLKVCLPAVWYFLSLLRASPIKTAVCFLPLPPPE